MSRLSTWKTKDGDLIPVKDLEDGHLLNILRMLERRAQDEFDNLSYPQSNGEMAQMYLESEWEATQRKGPTGMLPEIYDDLVEEAEKRGLKRESLI